MLNCGIILSSCHGVTMLHWKCWLEQCNRVLHLLFLPNRQLGVNWCTLFWSWSLDRYVKEMEHYERCTDNEAIEQLKLQPSLAKRLKHRSRVDQDEDELQTGCLRLCSCGRRRRNREIESWVQRKRYLMACSCVGEWQWSTDLAFKRFIISVVFRGSHLECHWFLQFMSWLWLMHKSPTTNFSNSKW